MANSHVNKWLYVITENQSPHKMTTKKSVRRSQIMLNRRIYILSLIIFGLLIPSIITGCSESDKQATPQMPGPNLAIELSLDDWPLLNDIVQLTCIASLNESSEEDALNTNITIELPNAIELVEGDLNWTGDIVRGTDVTIDANVKATQIGECEIKAIASYSSSNLNNHIKSAKIYLGVFEDRGFVSENALFVEDKLESLEAFVMPPENERHIHFDISLADTPILGKPIYLTCIATVTQDWPDAFIWAHFDEEESFEIISGDLQWAGDLLANSKIELNANIKPLKTGRWYIFAGGRHTTSSGEIETVRSDRWTVYVFEDGGAIVHEEPIIISEK